MFRILIYIIAIIGISALHIATVSILPFPYNTVNITIIAIALLILINRTTLAVSVALFIGFVTELYAITPFGFLISALIISLLIGILVATHVITTITFTGSTILILIMTLINRVSFFLLISAHEMSHNTFALMRVIQNTTAEIFCTTTVAMMVLALYFFFTRQTKGKISAKPL